jgi:MerR family copper efflux transcriptional regulator
MTLTIGQASEATGLSPDTLRYYERIGLLGGIGRNAGGQRRYREADIARLRFVRRAQSMDFSLDEIAQLLALRERQGNVRADVRALTETKLVAIEARIEALRRLRDELSGLISECRASEHGCPIIGRMDEADDNGRPTAGDRS